LNLQSKKIELQKDRILITETKEIKFGNNENIQKLKQKFKTELYNIVLNIKELKKRAEEIRKILVDIEHMEKETEKEVGPAKDPA